MPIGGLLSRISVSLCSSSRIASQGKRHLIRTMTSGNIDGINVKDWPAFQRLLSPELKSLVSYFDKHGHEIRIAGGAVRDLMAGKDSGSVADVDLATTATPQEMLTMFEQEQVRTINEQGIKHGTVTARIVLGERKITNYCDQILVTLTTHCVRTFQILLLKSQASQNVGSHTNETEV